MSQRHCNQFSRLAGQHLCKPLCLLRTPTKSYPNNAGHPDHKQSAQITLADLRYARYIPSHQMRIASA